MGTGPLLLAPSACPPPSSQRAHESGLALLCSEPGTGSLFRPSRPTALPGMSEAPHTLAPMTTLLSPCCSPAFILLRQHWLLAQVQARLRAFAHFPWPGSLPCSRTLPPFLLWPVGLNFNVLPPFPSPSHAFCAVSRLFRTEALFSTWILGVEGPLLESGPHEGKALGLCCLLLGTRCLGLGPGTRQVPGDIWRASERGFPRPASPSLAALSSWLRLLVFCRWRVSSC